MEWKPNFLVVGAGRSGTTSLHHYLSEHPQVFVPEIKSPSYFYAVDAPDKGRRRETRNYFVDSRSAYEQLFANSGEFRARGEVSPAYLFAPRVPERIASNLDDVRVIAVIRNPTDRLIARYVARKRDGLEPASRVLDVVHRETAAGIDLSDTAGTYVAAGFISHVLQKYVDLLGRDRVGLYLYDDYVANNQQTLAQMFEFLGVDTDVTVDTSTMHNTSRGVISQPLVRAAWERSARLRQTLRPFIPSRIRDTAFERITHRTTPVVIEPEERSVIDSIYAEEVEALTRILHHDLDAWKVTS